MDRFSRRAVALGLLTGLLAASPARADWEATSGDLGRSTSRIFIHAGASWTGVAGSDVERVDPAVGIEFGAAIRVWHSVSVYGSYALSSHDVKGQITQLLGQRVRPDRRSGNVEGTYEPQRIRAGIRVDGLSVESFRFHPYFTLGAVFSSISVKLDSVDGAPPQPSPDVDNELVDPSSFDESKIGGFLSAGAELAILSSVLFYVEGIYEVIEFPPGLNAMASATGGLALRF